MQYIDQVQGLVLGILMNKDMRGEVGIVNMRDELFTGEYAQCFRAIKTLYHEQRPIDPISVSKKMTEMGFTPDLPSYAVWLGESPMAVMHWKTYKADLFEAYKMRRLEEIKKDLAKNFDIQKAFDDFTELNGEKEVSASMDAYSAAMELTQKLIRIKDGKEKITLSPTYLRPLDKIISGFTTPDLILLGGRPAHGKTTLGLQLAFNMAFNGHSIGFVTLEMSRQQLVSRLVSNISSINGQKFNNVDKDMSIEEVNTIGRHIDRIKKLKLYISDLPHATTQSIEAEVVRLKRQHQIEGIFVDYLQLVSPVKEDATKQKVEQITNISKQFKALSKRQNIWVCVISSLSRDSEKRIDKRPYTSDLRESGQLEYDADKIIFVHRPSAYLAEDDPEFQKLDNLMEIIVRKNRAGETGTAIANTDLRYTRITEFQSTDVNPF
jgi:replicative DNA helicase